MLQDDYIITRKGIKPDPKQDREHKMNIEDLFLNRFYSFEEKERETNPSAFLLTEKESALLEDAIINMERAGAPLWDAIDQSKNPELIKAMINNVFEAFKAQKLSIKKLRALSDKFTTSLFWSITPEFSKDTDKNGVIVASTPLIFKVTISTDEKLKDIKLPDNHPFFTAETMQERAQALGLSDLYLYINRFDLGILEVLNMLFTLYDSYKASEQLTAAPEISADFYPIISTNVMNLLNDIGANAKSPKITKKKNEQGHQISKSEYLTTTGNNISFSDFTPYAAGGFISVGDPNTDKLLLQAQIITAQTGTKEIIIPFTDFMEFRGYSKNYEKDAKEKAKTACAMLRRAGSDVDIQDNLVSLSGGWNYVQKCLFISRRGRNGSIIKLQWTDDVFEHIIEHVKQGQQIELLNKSIVTISDKYPAAYNIAREFSRHYRRNAGKVNSHRLSVKTLINCVTSWPLYTDNYKDIPDEEKRNYIKYPSYATQKIIIPFIETMEYLTTTHKIFESYTFTLNGKSISDEELAEARKDYKKFITLNVDVVFCKEPNYTTLKERKAKRQEIAEKANAKKQPRAKKKR